MVVRMHDFEYRLPDKLRRIVGAEHLAESRIDQCDAAVDMNVECIRREGNKRAVSLLVFA